MTHVFDMFYQPYSYTSPHRQPRYGQSYNRRPGLPSWTVRSMKVAAVVVPLFVLLMTSLVLFSIDHPTVHNRRPTTPASYEEYVQKYGLCHPDMEPVPETSTNHSALKIYTACQKIRDLETRFYATSSTKVHPFQHEFIIDGADICDDTTDVIMIVHAFHDFYDRRKAIRETWGGAIVDNIWPNRRIQSKVKLVFMFGQHQNSSRNNRIKLESRQHSDIVQGDFRDSYNNMTLKSLMGLKWMSEYCPSAKYLVKSDDDMIINFPYLESVLASTNMTWSIMGPYNKGARVYRKSSKWAISTDRFPFYFYPPYESGSTYIISSDLVRPLFDTAERVPRLFIDDVYITGIIGRILNVNHKQQPGFAFWTNKAPKACDIIQDKVLTGTRMKPKLQYSLWNEIVNNKC